MQSIGFVKKTRQEEAFLPQFIELGISEALGLVHFVVHALQFQ